MRGGRIERTAVHSGDMSPGLRDDQGTRRNVPWLQVLLPERLESAGRHVTKVERGGAEPAHGARTPEEIAEERDELSPLFVNVVWKTGDKQRIDQGGSRRHVQRAAVQI